jgi:thiosulfate/3-mercaptopyruvate sulfurtransferase
LCGDEQKRTAGWYRPDATAQTRRKPHPQTLCFQHPQLKEFVMQLTQPIVSTQWLADNLDNPALRLFDVSQYLVLDPDGAHYRVESGLEKWTQSHIPGANYLDLRTEFSDTTNPLPATMLPYDKLAERCAAHGIGDDSCVVVYSAQ